MAINFKAIAESDNFQSFILCIILLTAVSMGLETIPELADSYYPFFDGLFYFTQTVFIVEIIIRVLAFAPNINRFFKGFWNIFDFLIVVLSLLPAVGSFIVIARLLRLLRVLRAISISDRLREFTSRLGEALDEIIYTSIILFILGYIFAISGHYLLSEIDPNNWGSLGRSVISVFYLSLLQDLPRFIEPAIKESIAYLLYFICFYFVQFGLILSVLNAAIAQSFRSNK